MLPGSALNQLIRVTDIMTIGLLVDGYRPSMAAIVLTLIANTVKIRVVPAGRDRTLLMKFEQADRL